MRAPSQSRARRQAAGFETTVRTLFDLAPVVGAQLLVERRDDAQHGVPLLVLRRAHDALLVVRLAVGLEVGEAPAPGGGALGAGRGAGRCTRVLRVVVAAVVVVVAVLRAPEPSPCIGLRRHVSFEVEGSGDGEEGLSTRFF
jgi:hypothetical protein